jgi:hypothetical protein
VPLTSPVHLTNIEDIHAVDLHVRYCELVKAYETLVLCYALHPPANHSASTLAQSSSPAGPTRPNRLCRPVVEVACMGPLDDILSLLTGSRSEPGQEGTRTARHRHALRDGKRNGVRVSNIFPTL